MLPPSFSEMAPEDRKVWLERQRIQQEEEAKLRRRNRHQRIFRISEVVLMCVGMGAGVAALAYVFLTY